MEKNEIFSLFSYIYNMKDIIMLNLTMLFKYIKGFKSFTLKTLTLYNIRRIQ